MSLRRLPISAAALAAVAVLGLAACGGDSKTKTVTVQATPASGTSAESGKTVNIIASVPPTDHGWLGAISKNAKAAEEALSATLEAALVTASVRMASLRFDCSRKKATMATRASTAIPMITPPMPEPPFST